MSGHSKWSTIKRQKETKDIAKSKVFSRLSRAISIAVKSGGGPDPNSNYKLRIAIDTARSANMPKDNIERAISKASSSADLYEITYEGFGPNGISVMVETATDNKNRTSQEIKNLLERGGGSLGGPGSVSFNFEHKGFIQIQKDVALVEAQMLKLIDLGVENIDDNPSTLDVYVSPSELSTKKELLEKNNFIILKTELIQKAINLINLPKESREKIDKFIDAIYDHDDVQAVYTNASYN
ncbi:hypothetical protein A2382_03885 [Candidatus Woesebacteria bacterium RIFOXYB1_FULL_38_16]|uniref:Probable transcriptional regulatory protein A2382_03885 n=1 Tax=Candidatus Woesebacteria bacterium RIFOXYB1_FULL_38_16 TaxID=1802538 RepID=A0A1F8CVE8_9BACT|nr:MAG: hypothetical protein A2382_03885 [Candidatus Woesebacteria bacterium RIFOXYB1_FULL_38_16]